MATDSKTTVTLIQNAAGQVVAVKVGDGAPFKVLHAGPVVGVGKLNVALTIEDIQLDYGQSED